MDRQILPAFMLASITCLVISPTECASPVQTRRGQTGSASEARSQTPRSLKKYFPQRVGKLVLATENVSSEESESMKRSWVSLFGATEFARGIYSDPKAQELSQAIEASVLLTVASCRSGKQADSAVTSLTTVLAGRGYAIERQKLGKSAPGKQQREVTVAASSKADDWAVIWTSGPVVLQVQSPKKKENALNFARSFPY